MILSSQQVYDYIKSNTEFYVVEMRPHHTEGYAVVFNMKDVKIDELEISPCFTNGIEDGKVVSLVADIEKMVETTDGEFTFVSNTVFGDIWENIIDYDNVAFSKRHEAEYFKRLYEKHLLKMAGQYYLGCDDCNPTVKKVVKKLYAYCYPERNKNAADSY